MFKIPKITHVQLIAANVHYRLFGKLIESPFHFENFDTPVVESPFLAKVVETLSSSSFANGSSGHSFRFMKYFSCPNFVKRLLLFMKIERLF